jgi:hypothetical protein
MPRLTFVAVAFSALSFSTAAAAQTSPAERGTADYTVLKRALEARYSNLAWLASPESGVDLPAIDRRTLADLSRATTDDDVRRSLLAFIAAFHDGHLSQLPVLAPSTTLAGAEPRRPAYTRNDPAGGCAAQGYALPDRVAFSLPFESLAGFQLLTDGAAQAFRSGVLAVDSATRVGIVRIPSFHTNAYPSLCVAAWTGDSWNADGTLRPGALGPAVETLWYETLAATLRSLAQRGATIVMVDVGNNSGGDDSGDMSARLFTAMPLHSAPLWMSQNDTASTAYFDEELGELRRALALSKDMATTSLIERTIATWTTQRARLREPACSLHWVWQEQRAWKTNECRRLVEAGSAGGPLSYLDHPIDDAGVAGLLHWPARFARLQGAWTGPLYVLTNGRTYSSAEMFAAVLQNNRAAKIVGTPTGGDGCGFMNDPPPVVLPHTGLRFRVPNCVRIRSDGSDEVAGVTPDIAMPATEGESNRQRAQRVVDTVARATAMAPR